MSHCDRSHLIALLDCPEETERHPNYRGWPSPSSIAPSGRYAAPAFLSCPPVPLPLTSASAVSWEMVSPKIRELVLVWKYIPLKIYCNPVQSLSGRGSPKRYNSELQIGMGWAVQDYSPFTHWASSSLCFSSLWAYLRICPTVFGLLNAP